MPTDYELKAHRDWINLLRPVGLVVSAPALANAQAYPDKNIIKQQQAYLALGENWLGFAKFAEAVLGWKPGKLISGIPDELCLPLPDFHETLRPTFAVKAPKEDGTDWLMLIVELGQGTSLDEPAS